MKKCQRMKVGGATALKTRAMICKEQTPAARCVSTEEQAEDK